jgi:hypothetical protein
MKIHSLKAPTSAGSQKIAVSTTAAKTTAITAGVAVVTPDVDCFMRLVENNGAAACTNDGTDQFLLANNAYRVDGIGSGDVLCFRTAAGTGSVYVTPE